MTCGMDIISKVRPELDVVVWFLPSPSLGCGLCQYGLPWKLEDACSENDK